MGEFPCALCRSESFLAEVEEQNLGLVYASELDGFFGGDSRAIACFQWRAVQLNAASRDLHVGRLEPLFFRKHPDLVQVHRLRLGRVEFAMRHAGTRAHILHVTRLDHGPVPHAVFVLQSACQHVRNDLHVPVRVLRKAAPSRDAVVVHHPQRAELHMLRIEVIGKRKREMRIQPAVVRAPAFITLANFNHGPPPGSCKPIILVITTIVKRYIYASLLSRRLPRPGLLPTLCFCELCTAPSASFRRRLLWCTVITKARHHGPEDFSMDSPLSATTTRKLEGSATPRETLTITDNRTGKSYEVPVTHGTIRAADLRQIKVDPKDFGMMSYDPAFNNTASCISKVTFIDGDAGILRYRGYPIED